MNPVEPQDVTTVAWHCSWVPNAVVNCAWKAAPQAKTLVQAALAASLQASAAGMLEEPPPPPPQAATDSDARKIQAGIFIWGSSK
jgi:hypothetical protein